LYLTSDPDTAVAEGSRDKLLIPPSVLFTVKVRLEKVIDLENNNIIDSLGIIRDELKNPWRKAQDIEGEKAYTQILGELLYDSGDIEAIRYPSAIKNGAYNLAIFVNRLGKGSDIKVYDPEKRIRNIALIKR
jgi:RES domain-containing protein